jgi:ribosomal protein S18 acetylase RimI-like enzyme
VTAAGPFVVDTMTADSADGVARFASQRRLSYADFASIAILVPDEPRVWTAAAGTGADDIAAAAIDDGLAMSVAGDLDALRHLSHVVPDLDSKLVIAGRVEEVRAFVEAAPTPRRERHEHFMSVHRTGLAHQPEPIPLRIADDGDLGLLCEVRANALEEEYGMPVRRDGKLYGELSRAVTRAVAMQGVAIWVEGGKVAFTAQLIAKTADASSFGDLYTDPALRGQGRATRALTAFCAWLMTESEHVTLRVGVDNTPAVRLYERCGFEVVDDFMSSLGPEQD